MSSQKELIENLNEIKNQKDTVLIPENIKSGINILGVEGSLDVVNTADATADGEDILKGKTAYVKGYKITGMYEPLDTSDATAGPEHITTGKTAYVNGQKITGNIPTNGNLYYTPNTEDQEIPAGYTEGGTVWGDSNLKPENIKNGVSIFNVDGTYVSGLDTSDATAVASQILAGQTAYVKDVKITGTMPDQGSKIITPGPVIQSFPYGYYSNLQVRGDSNLIPENIKAGTTIFGVEGDLDVALDTSDATASASDLKLNKTAYVNGEKITGTHSCVNTFDATANETQILAGQTAYVKDVKLTGTMRNIINYEVTPGKDSVVSYQPYGYVQTVLVKSVTDSINEYTLPSVVASDAQGGIKGLTELTGEITTQKGCRVFAMVVNRAAIASFTDGWEEITSDIINYTELYQEMHIYTKIAESITESFTVEQVEANRLFLTMLSYDAETDVEIVAEAHDDTKTQKTVIMQGTFLPGDIVIGHYEYNAADKSDPTYNSTLSGPSHIAYKTPDEIDRLFVYVLTSKASSMTFDLKYENPHGIKVLRFTSAQPLVPENIRKGIKIMDFVGTFEGEFDHSDATVTENDLLEGVKAYNANGELIIGTLPNNDYLEFVPSSIIQEIPEGYILGGKIAAVDITTLDDYQKCETIADTILGDYEYTEYIELEYIESDGNQYIDTEVKTTSGYRIESKINVTKWYDSNSCYFAGFLSYETYRDYTVFYNSTLLLGMGADIPSTTTCSLNTWYDIDMSTISGNGFIKLNNEILTTSTNEVSHGNINIWIFGVNYYGSSKFWNAYIKMGRTKIYDSTNTLVRDFIPVKMKLSGDIGMYDKLNKVFYANKGTGSFIAGGVV